MKREKKDWPLRRVFPRRNLLSLLLCAPFSLHFGFYGSAFRHGQKEEDEVEDDPPTRLNKINSV